MKLLLTGGFGLIGTRLLELWESKYDVVVLDRVDDSALFPLVKFVNVDITNQRAVASVFDQEKPDWVVHLAAFTDVEKAEIDREIAWELNVDATVNLAEAAKKHNCRFIYLSTGFVFDGSQVTYSETDSEKPVNYYGLTKTEGERAITKLDLGVSIIRINFPYRTKWDKKSDTIRWMVPKLLQGEKITLVKDQFISPTFIDDLAPVISKIIAGNKTGVFHVAPTDCVSFYEIGQLLAAELGVSKELVKETTLDEYLISAGKKANQPRRSCLVSTNLEKELGVKPTSLREGLQKVKESYLETKTAVNRSLK